MYAWIMWMWMNKWYSFCAWSLHHPNISVFKIFFFHLFEKEREWERNFPPTRSPLMHLEQLGLGKDQNLGLSLGHTYGLQGVMKHMSCHLLPPRAHISRELVGNRSATWNEPHICARWMSQVVWLLEQRPALHSSTQTFGNSKHTNKQKSRNVY